ncbi:tyrosine-protein phosphatase [Thermodesulfobacteriota bacterium]
MIDLHCHILPGLDDGPRDWDESLAMCRMARADGIRTVAATPHIKPGLYHQVTREILGRVTELNRRIADDATGGAHGLWVLAGADAFLEPDIGARLSDGTVPTLGHGGPKGPLQYFLLELPDYFRFDAVTTLIEELRARHMVPVLTHPERNGMFQRSTRLLAACIEAGALSQVTAMSITGQFGGLAQKSARTFVRKDLAHVIASDAHSAGIRPPVLSAAVEKIGRIRTSIDAEMMVTAIPRAILEGREVRL